MINQQLYTGTSGLVLPVPNKLAFPPEFRQASRLTYYAHLFNSLEVNSSFYKVPMAVTVSKWAQAVPENFRFTYKMFKGITHNKLLAFDEAQVTHFMQVINGAGTKKGSLLVQFPGGTQYNLQQLKKLLACIQKSNALQWQVSVEFRHTSWYRQSTYKLLASNNAGMVIHDIPRSATPPVPQFTNHIYLRFHGPAGDYRGGYTDEFLQQQADTIKTWLHSGHTVYVYFNNTIGDAIKNVAKLNSYF